LQAAAIAGRELDLRVLRGLDSEMPFEEWLAVVQASMIVDLREGRWRFSHDKLREAVLQDLRPADARLMHRQVAHAIEMAYPADRREPFWNALVAHWRACGDEEKERHYATLAGLQALRSSAYPDAIELLERAQQLAQARGRSHEERAELEEALGAAAYGASKMEKCIYHSRQALALINMPSVPDNTAGLVLAYGRHLSWQLSHRLLPAALMRARGRLRERRWRAARLLVQVGQPYVFLGDRVRGVLTALSGLNLVEGLPESDLLAYNLGAMAFAMGAAGLPRLSRYYSRRAIKVLDALPQEPTTPLAMAYHATSSLWVGQGYLQRAADYGLRAQSLFATIGDQRRWAEATANLAFLAALRGDFNEALSLRQVLYRAGQRYHEPAVKLWALAGNVQIFLRQRRFDAAEMALREREALLDGPDYHSTANVAVYWLYYHWLKGETEQVWALLEDALVEARVSAITEVHNAFLHYNLAEVTVGLWQLAREQGGDVTQAENAMREALGSLKQFGQAFPLARPRTDVWVGMVAWLDGQPQRAIRLWEQALDGARRLGLPYEEILAQVCLARYHHEALARAAAAEAARQGLRQLRLWHEAEQVELLVQTGADDGGPDGAGKVNGHSTGGST
jgi:tetratricopeptide (TPR) repeat protein